MGRHFTREKFQRIKYMLIEWAEYTRDRRDAGWPKQSPFVTEKVQDSNRSTATYIQPMPNQIRVLDETIDELAPTFKAILNWEYRKEGTQTNKAEALGITRETFAKSLSFIHEQLDFQLFGDQLSVAQLA